MTELDFLNVDIEADEWQPGEIVIPVEQIGEWLLCATEPGSNMSADGVWRKQVPDGEIEVQVARRYARLFGMGNGFHYEVISAMLWRRSGNHESIPVWAIRFEK